MLRRFISAVDGLNSVVGRIAMQGIFVMMAILMWSTISKLIGEPSHWTLEGAQFAMISYFFLGGAYAIQTGAHVRMDLFYEEWSTRTKAIVDAISIVCLVVFLLILLWGAVGSFAYSLGYFGTDPFGFLIGYVTGSESTGVMERSRTIWRPYLWPIKLVMIVGILLMLLQAASEFSKDILRIRGEDI